ncbi:hypothetical protein H5410_031154 [Solanum commersonii]|uniref:Uncharacterized protein n=1 Tax=Solanum commersonii TaxID=4109 RepID=A0A9J5YJF5_SOLCO|nr:hypothetical protein H5410_031154 [Solanum commersonii]
MKRRFAMSHKIMEWICSILREASGYHKKTRRRNKAENHMKRARILVSNDKKSIPKEVAISRNVGEWEIEEAKPVQHQRQQSIICKERETSLWVKQNIIELGKALGANFHIHEEESLELLIQVDSSRQTRRMENDNFGGAWNKNKSYFNLKIGGLAQKDSMIELRYGGALSAFFEGGEWK